MASDAGASTPWATPSGSSTPASHLSDRYDVVVVGAGIVGLVTALRVAEAGRSVVVLEAREPGAGTTGRSTAKASLLQGTRASQIRRALGAEVLAGYLAANRSGLDLLQGFAGEDAAVGEAADAWTYATDDAGADAVRAEAAALAAGGLPAILAVPDELPFPTTAAVRLPEQLRLDPGALVGHLLSRLARVGVPVAWPVRARGVRTRADGFEVVASAGQRAEDAAGEVRVRSDWVVLATLLPFPLRTALFAATTPQLSYALVGRPTTAPVPVGMYLSAGRPTRSVRGVGGDGGQRLLVGGSGHPVGRPGRGNAAHRADLVRWSALTYGLVDVEHWWAAHDYQSADLLPHVGAAPFGPERLLVATGFGKWGMTNGAGAAVALAATILGSPPDWAAPLTPRLAAGVTGWGHLATANLQVGLGLVRGWVTDPGRGEPTEGAGVVQRTMPHPTAVSLLGGTRRACSAVCTHVGGIVRWNDAELSWDCPLHGSRFAPDGDVLTGPAVASLPAKGADRTSR